jgi:hypothetical protein
MRTSSSTRKSNWVREDFVRGEATSANCRGSAEISHKGVGGHAILTFDRTILFGWLKPFDFTKAVKAVSEEDVLLVGSLLAFNFGLLQIIE